MPPAFPVDEYRKRMGRARAALSEAGLSGCVASAPEHLYYYGGYDAHTHFSQQALVFAADGGDPTLVIRDIDVPPGADDLWFDDVRPYRFGGDDPVAIIADVAREKGLSGRIGLDLQSYAVPGTFALALIDAIAPAEGVDATDTIGGLRVVKSAREMTLIREAGRYAEIGRAALLDAIAEGTTENALAGAVDAAMRAAGSSYPAMPTWLATGPRTSIGHFTPTNRALARGELVKLETAGVADRYHALTIETCALGDPGERVREAHAAAIAALEAGADACIVGNPVSRAEVAATAVLEKTGFGGLPIARFGYGVGAAYPLSWLEPLHIIRESDRPFEAGMTFCLHVSFGLPDAGFGILVGGTYALTEGGLECLAGNNLAISVL
jgi:Xaa-Pro dipeptidase